MLTKRPIEIFGEALVSLTFSLAKKGQKLVKKKSYLGHFCVDIEECKYEGSAKEQIFNDKLKESYNMYAFKSNEYLDLTNGYYYVKALGIGGSKYKSTASNILYEFIGEELIIKEQIGIINEAGGGGHVDIYNGDDIVKQYSSKNLIEDNTNYEEVTEEYIKNNFETFNTYKHTFRQHEDGTYYWYSTELAN